MKPRFSILMCNYNKSRYIDDAIRSVLAQTFADWELIFVDDASNDGSLDRIKPYLSDPRIRLYAKDVNSGYTRSLIYGLSKVASPLVGILDSDDALVPEAIEKAPPAYPDEARRQLVDGIVWVQALIGVEGRVHDAVVRSGPPALRDASLEAVWQWQFKPARADGHTLAVWVLIPVKFTLN